MSDRRFGDSKQGHLLNPQQEKAPSPPVAGPSEGTSDPLPPDYLMWTHEHVRQYFLSKKTKFRLEDKYITRFYDAEVSGIDLPDLEEEKVLVNSYMVPLAVARRITKLITAVTKPQAPEGDTQKRKASDESSEHLRYMKRLAGLPAPSEISRSWRQTSYTEPFFLNHRPASSIGLPTELLHPVFGTFLDDCRGAKPEADDYIFTKKFSEAMSAYYQSDADRAHIFRELFKQHFTINLNCIEVDGSRTDGTWSPNPTTDFIALNAEVKKEPGTGGNPHIQNVAYYKQYLRQYDKSGSKLIERTRLPCFLIQVDGPELNISTVIYGNKIIVDPYHFTLSLACSPTPTRLKDLARIFRALKDAIEVLRSYYNGPPPQIPADQRRFPYPCSFNTTSSKVINFSYHDTAFDSHPLVFLVDVMGNEESLPKRLVKFTQRYPKQIHERCASLHIAPELYGCEALPGGWFMVVMEYMADYHNMSKFTSDGLMKAKMQD